jgi:hypothetical protein|tara:strand:- start:1163 stop:1336 length:174 start_codon:yes stop_codon:yes gene_type:complete
MKKSDFLYLLKTTIGQSVFDQMCQAVLFSKHQMIFEMKSNEELVAQFISKCINKGAK